MLLSAPQASPASNTAISIIGHIHLKCTLLCAVLTVWWPSLTHHFQGVLWLLCFSLSCVNSYLHAETTSTLVPSSNVKAERSCCVWCIYCIRSSTKLFWSGCNIKKDFKCLRVFELACEDSCDPPWNISDIWRTVFWAVPPLNSPQHARYWLKNHHKRPSESYQ